VISKYGIKNHTQKNGWFFQNTRERLSIDEILSNGELYTIWTNKKAKVKEQ
jgi:hypothetical protein